MSSPSAQDERRRALGCPSGLVMWPETLTVPGEAGVDRSQLRSEVLEEFDGQRFDWVVLIGHEESENRPPVEGDSETGARGT